MNEMINLCHCLLLRFMNKYLKPVTAGGTVRRKAVTVAMATSLGLHLVMQLLPEVTMLGFSIVPSRYTWCSNMALYTAVSTCKPQVNVHELQYTCRLQSIHRHCGCHPGTGPNLFCDKLRAFQVMVSIWHDFRLNNWYNTMLEHKWEKAISLR